MESLAASSQNAANSRFEFPSGSSRSNVKNVTKNSKEDKQHLVTEEEVNENAMTEGYSNEEELSKEVFAAEEGITKQYTYDVFISYCSVDTPWVRDVLVKILEENDLNVCVDYRDFVPGASIMENITQAIMKSRVTVLVLTPNYVDSKWCHYETRYAIGMSLSSSEGRVLPLILMPCDIPLILRHLTYLDYTSEDVKPRFREILLESLKGADKLVKPSTDFRIEDLVEDVVIRRIESQNERVKKKKDIEGKLAYRNRISRCCFSVPLIIIVLISIGFAIFILAIRTVLLNNQTYTSSSAVTITLDIGSILCKSISVDTSSSGSFDFYTYSDKKDAEYLNTSTEHFTLAGSQGYKTMILPNDKNMDFSLRFCMHSATASSKVDIYELSTSQYSTFTNTWPREEYFTPKTFRNNSCHAVKINSEQSNEGKISFVVLAYRGKGNFSVVAKSSLTSTKFDTSKALSQCKSTRLCTLPGWPLTKFTIITKNITNLELFQDQYYATCFIGVFPRVVGGVFIGLSFIVWCVLYKCCMKKKCISWNRRKVLQQYQEPDYEWYVENSEVKYRRV